jgi:hypothetical protein
MRTSEEILDEQDGGEGTSEDEKLLGLAQSRFDRCVAAETRIRELALDDLKFRSGEQWPEEIKAQRQQDSRPCLTINRLPSFLRQVTNEQRQNRPAIRISPVDSGADPETAEVLQGLIRNIEVQSGADVAIDTAFEAAATGGFGYFRVITDYCDPMSFDQDIKVERIRNAFSVYFDPDCSCPVYSDAHFAFVVSHFSKEEFAERYPGAMATSLSDYSGIGDRGRRWFTEDSIRVAEYYWIETKKRTLAQLADGKIMWEDEAPEGVAILRRRETEERIVNYAEINGVEVLKRGEWAGKWIPIVPVLGDEMDVDGDRQLVGLIRYAKDPQRMYNYMATAQVEAIALAPKAPFVGAEGQFEGHEAKWASANTKNYAYLEYRPQNLSGGLAPPPMRQQFEPAIVAINQAMMSFADDMKSTTGIYDASLGARGNETSGKAILARQQEGDTANYHLVDNLSRSIRFLGRILVDLIPKIYDSERVIRIIGADEKEQTVELNRPTKWKGVVGRIFDLSVGKYDVTVQTGPSYASRRQQAVEAILELVRAYPMVAQVAGDLLVKNMDWPGAQEVAERLRKTLPPALQDPEDGEQQIPPQVAAELAAAQQQLQVVVAQLQDANGIINEKQIEERLKRLEIDSRERIEALKVQADLVKLEAQIASKESIELLKAELAATKAKADAIASPGLVGDEGPEEIPIAA